MWDGAFNLIDLGGLPLHQGERTARGRVYRSGAVEYLTVSGWKQANDAGVTTVIDLRNPAEIRREPHHPVVDAVPNNLTKINLPTEDPADEEFLRVCGPWLDHPRSYADNLKFYPEKFAAIFHRIAQADGAVLIHCAGGRDRTGMITAILLRLAGTPVEAIAENYEAAVRGTNDHQLANPGHGSARSFSAEELNARLLDRRAVLSAWIADFDARAYLAGLGLPETEIDVLACMLHPSAADPIRGECRIRQQPGHP